MQLTQHAVSPLQTVSAWNVAWTKSRCEKSVADFLQSRGVTSFLPLVLKRRRYGARDRSSYIPLFAGYVFYDADSIDRSGVFSSRKVAEILTPDDPQKLSQELQTLQSALTVDPSLREMRFGIVGKPVIVKGGPLKGMEGEVIRLQSGSRLIVRISFLGKAAEMQIDESFLEPLL